MGHYDMLREELARKQQEEHENRVTRWGTTAPTDSICAEIDKIKQDMLQLKYEIKSLRREIEMGRYDNLHGDEDEVKYTWEELEDLRMLEADLQNDRDWIESHE